MVNLNKIYVQILKQQRNNESHIWKDKLQMLWSWVKAKCYRTCNTLLSLGKPSSVANTCGTFGNYKMWTFKTIWILSYNVGFQPSSSPQWNLAAESQKTLRFLSSYHGIQTLIDNGVNHTELSINRKIQTTLSIANSQLTPRKKREWKSK